MSMLKLISGRNLMIKDTFVYLSASIINKAIPFLMLPILTKYLTPAEFGILATYQVVLRFGESLFGFTTASNITRNFFKHDKEYISRIVFNLLVLLLVTTTLGLIVIFLLLQLRGNLFDLPSKWLYAITVITFMNMANGFNLEILRNRKESVEFGLIEFARTFVNFAVSIWLITWYAAGWEGRAWGVFIGALLGGVYSIIRLHITGYISVHLDFKILREIFQISLPMTIHGVGVIVINLSDRIFITQLVSTAELGIYSVGYQFGMLTLVVVTALNSVWKPHFFEIIQVNTATNRIKIVRKTYFLISIIVILAVLIAYISYLLIPVMTTPEYHNSYKYVIWVSLAYAFNGFYSIFHGYGIHAGKTGYMAVVTTISALLNLVLNFYLVKVNGALGAAQATLITFIFMSLIVWWYSVKLYPMPWFRFQRN